MTWLLYCCYTGCREHLRNSGRFVEYKRRYYAELGERDTHIDKQIARENGLSYTVMSL